MIKAYNISIHAAREGGDACAAVAEVMRRKFQSTPPVKAATSPLLSIIYSIGLFQSTPPVKAATVPLGTGTLSLYISIHAAREGGDFNSLFRFNIYKISIHAAREGGDCGNE